MYGTSYTRVNSKEAFLLASMFYFYIPLLFQRASTILQADLIFGVIIADVRDTNHPI